MFLSRVINRELYRLLSESPGVTSVVGNRIYRGLQYPEGVALPACLFYMEFAKWDGAVQTLPAEHLDSGEYRFVVRFDGEGASDTVIAPAAQAQLEAIAGAIVDTDDGYQVTFTATGETPVTSTFQGATQYQRLGTIYQVFISKS